MSNPLFELLKASPNCRVTITCRPARKKAKNPRPKPQIGDRRLRGWSWFRYDFMRCDGCYVVGPRGGHRYEWRFEREATSEERAAAKLERSARRAVKL